MDRPDLRLAAALLVALPWIAARSDDNCTGGGAINVTANNVIIDCNGFRVGG